MPTDTATWACAGLAGTASRAAATRAVPAKMLRNVYASFMLTPSKEPSIAC